MFSETFFIFFIELKRIFFIATLGLLFLASCGGSEKIATEATTTSSSTSLSTTSSTLAVTTTTQTVIATTTTIDPEDWVGPRHPLTGLPTSEGIIPRPALAVKIGNNDVNSLPHEGLAEADIVY